MSFPALPKEHSCSPKDLETGSASKNFVSPAPSMIHPEEDNTGIISIGWQRDAHNLVSVHDNGDRYNPWTSSAHLEDFDPVDACYFADSSPEKRKPDLEGSGYFDFALYPVIGLCGQRKYKINYPDKADTQSFLQACRGAADAVVIYLYFSPYDEEPGLKFTKQ